MLGVDAPWAGRGSIFCCISTKLSVHTSVPSRFDKLRAHSHLPPGDYDRAVTTTSPQSEPEVLTVGPGEAGRLSRRGKFILVAVVVALLAGLLLWRFWPTPAPLFALSDVQGVYAGMVRSRWDQ